MAVEKKDVVNVEETKVAETKAPEMVKKEVVKKEPAKKSAAPKKAATPKKEAAPKKEVVAKTPVAKTPAAKKPAAKKVEPKASVVIEFAGKTVVAKDILAEATKAFTKANKGVVIKTMEVYVKPEEHVAYYVVNGAGADEYKIEL